MFVNRQFVALMSIGLTMAMTAGACGQQNSTTKASPHGVTPAPRSKRLLNVQTGRPMFTGPNGEAGYGGPQAGAQSWTMPDGIKAWYVAGTSPSQGNVEALQNA